MPLPSIIQRLYSFTGFQQAQGDSEFPGTQVDIDLDQTNNALNGLISAFRGAFREDGKLADGSVTRNALAADVRLGLGASRPWVTGATYAENDTVTFGYGLYQALAPHVAAADFNTDLSAARWTLVADLSQAVIIADAGISTQKLVGGAVTEPKLADGAVSSRVVAPNVITRSHAALNLGVVPVGAEIDYAGVFAPPGWLVCDGLSVSRDTYADLFNALCPIFAADIQVGSTVLTDVTYAFQTDGVLGALVEGPGVQPGSLITAVNGGTAQIALNAPATSNQTRAVYRVFPFLAYSATTFALPDRRGRVVAGRDRGTGRNTSQMQGDRLGATGGVDQLALSIPQLPTFTPSGSISSLADFQLKVPFDRSDNGYAGGGGLGGVVHIGAENAPDREGLLVAGGGHTHTFTGSSIGNGVPHANLQPTGVANRIIFAGV